jgi:hypothetical protein
VPSCPPLDDTRANETGLVARRSPRLTGARAPPRSPRTGWASNGSSAGRPVAAGRPGTLSPSPVSGRARPRPATAPHGRGRRP